MGWTLNSVAKLVLGFGVLVAVGAALAGFFVPVGEPSLGCSGAFASAHVGAEQIAQTAAPGSYAASAPLFCATDAERARPDYLVVIGIGLFIVFVGLLLAARKPKFTPIASELAVLDALREKGVITGQEFEAQKLRLLGPGLSAPAGPPRTG